MKSDAVVICGEDDLLCPICAEEMDEADISMFPCPCDYQICLWCLKRIRDQENNRCPLCRREYEESNMRKVAPRKIVRQKQSSEESQIARSIDVEFSKTPTVCRLYNCPATLLSAQTLAEFKYMGKYGKLLSVTVIPYRNVETAFIIYAEESQAQLAHTDITKLVQKTSQANLKSMRLHVGAARHCIHALRGATCPNEHCPFTHGHVNRNAKTFWRRKLNQVTVSQPQVTTLINDPDVDSLFGKSENDLAPDATVEEKKPPASHEAVFPALEAVVQKEERKKVVPPTKQAKAIFIPPPPSLLLSNSDTSADITLPPAKDEAPLAVPPGFTDGPPGYTDGFRRTDVMPDGGAVYEHRAYPPGMDDDVFQRARRLIEGGLDMMGGSDLFGWDAYDPEKGRGSRWLDGLLNMHFGRQSRQTAYPPQERPLQSYTQNSFVSSSDFDWGIPVRRRGDIVSQLLNRGEDVRWDGYHNRLPPPTIHQHHRVPPPYAGSSMVPGLSAKHPGIEHYNSDVDRSGVDLLRSVIPNAKISFVDPKQHIR